MGEQKCSLSKNDGLSSIPNTHEKVSVAEHMCNPSTLWGIGPGKFLGFSGGDTLAETVSLKFSDRIYLVDAGKEQERTLVTPVILL